MHEVPSAIRHYGTSDLTGRVGDALAQAGLGDDRLTFEDLAAMDQFHVGGLPATEDLAARLSIERGGSLLDVGCGNGGASRYLAAKFGCEVTGIDFNAPFIELAKALTERAGLSDLVHYLAGDATELPFESETFDVAWTQHVAMNIANRAKLYGGVFRVLRKGARFGIYDVVIGNGESIEFPLPWATDPANSFLKTADETRTILEQCGFVIQDWRDTTQDAMAWMRGLQAALTPSHDGRPPLGLPLLMGPDFPKYAANLAKNMQAGRLRILMGVVSRPV